MYAENIFSKVVVDMLDEPARAAQKEHPPLVMKDAFLRKQKSWLVWVGQKRKVPDKR